MIDEKGDTEHDMKTMDNVSAAVPTLPSMMQDTQPPVEGDEVSITAVSLEAAAEERPHKKRRVTAEKPTPVADPQKTGSLYKDMPDSDWLRNLFAFHLFRSRNGLTVNPSRKSENEDEKRLATWVNSQRELLSKVNNGKGGSVTRRKVEVLRQIKDFPFNKPFSDRVQQHIIELRAYKEKYGHTNVPARSGSLGRWVIMVRVKYNSGRLDSNTITQLEEIGFDWSQWESMYQQLKEYKEQFGDCVVPRREKFKRLNRWVTTQRQNYKVPGKLSQDRILKLEEIGFVWSVGIGKPKINAVNSNPEGAYHKMSCL